MKITELKVKIKSLAAEARIIVHEEQRVLRRAAYLAEDPRGPAVWVAYRSLRDHRRAVVGTAARRSLLAYGFLRGLPYARIEPSNSSTPDWDAVWRVAERFASAPGQARIEDPDRTALLERWTAWRAEAEAHRSI